MISKHSRDTWPEKIVPQLRRAQEEGGLEERFRVEDARRVVPECPKWLLSDHRHGNPEGRPVWFVRHERGLYSLA